MAAHFRVFEWFRLFRAPDLSGAIREAGAVFAVGTRRVPGASGCTSGRRDLPRLVCPHIEGYRHARSHQATGQDPQTTRAFTTAEIQKIVKPIIIKQLGVDARQVVDSATFVDDLGADSLYILELVLAFDEAFEIEITDDMAQTVFPKGTVRDAVKLVAAILAEAKRLTQAPAPESHAKKPGGPRN
jgi:acyl carrier protein